MDSDGKGGTALKRPAGVGVMLPGRSPTASAQSGTHLIGSVAHSARAPALPAPLEPSVPPPPPALALPAVPRAPSLPSELPEVPSLFPRVTTSLLPAARAAKKVFLAEGLHTASLSAIAGFVEASAFLALFGLFPAHITGALVWASASAAASETHGVLVRLTVIPTFIAAILIASVVARLERRRRANPLPLLLSLMTFSLATFCAAGVVLGEHANRPDSVAVTVISGAGVFAMGIQNALMRESLSGLCLTTMMTGNLTQFGIEVVNFCFALADSTPHNRTEVLRDAGRRLSRFGTPVAGFLAGAVTGGYLTHAFGLGSLAFPTLICAALTAAAFRAYR